MEDITVPRHLLTSILTTLQKLDYEQADADEPRTTFAAALNQDSFFYDLHQLEKLLEPPTTTPC